MSNANFISRRTATTLIENLKVVGFLPPTDLGINKILGLDNTEDILIGTVGRDVVVVTPDIKAYFLKNESYKDNTVDVSGIAPLEGMEVVAGFSSMFQHRTDVTAERDMATIFYARPRKGDF